MKKVISWNNRRHGVAYWISIVVLFFVGFDFVSFYSMDSSSLPGILRDKVFELYSHIMPSFVNNAIGVEYYLYTLITFYLIGLVFVFLMNHVLGIIPNLRASERPHRYGYLTKTVVIGDIVVGILLEMNAFRGIFASSREFSVTSIVIWLYIAVILYGSYLYWKSTLLLRKMRMINENFRYEKDYEKNTWYCISNCRERVSTFSRAPWKGKVRYIIVDKEDLEIRNSVSDNSFLYYLLLIDTHQKFEPSLSEEVERILLMPHANVVILLFGATDEYSHLIENIENQKSVHIYKYPSYDHCEKLDFESLMEEVAFHNKKIKVQPVRFINNEALLSVYSKIGEGPKICLDFFKIIMNELDLMPAIYALFDYVDLQYRIQVAFTLDSTFEGQCVWMRKNWRKIGNINEMGKIIEDPVIFEAITRNTEQISTRDFYEVILSKEDMRLINKYLPNYERDYSRPIQDAIVYLTTSLRNVLRGHGTFEKEDSLSLYKLVFKLALLNLYILNGNSVDLLKTDTAVWQGKEYTYYQVRGSTVLYPSQALSPFLVATTNGNILVFNNWNKDTRGGQEQIEYINYLDGTLILPEYRSVDVI